MEALHTTRTLEFILSYDDIDRHVIQALRDPNGKNKGILVTVDVTVNSATGRLDVNTHIAAAMGDKNANGAVPQVAASRTPMCPHPPACY